ncbi:MAG: outer membrane protein assembly factor BamA [Candidatus Marinimicrobia bacterium]|nr:outer membrane protein assembly factor BamA [Candidatus Neomarinimicrobiota bacterium]
MINYRILIFLLINLIFCQYQISNIDIEGLNRLKKDDIYRISKLYPTMYIESGDEINKAVSRLWDIQRFKNIQIYVIDETESSLALKIELEELPVIGTVSFEGNKKQTDKQLSNLIEITEGQILSQNSLFDFKKKIEDYYKEKHFHNVGVESKLIDTSIPHIKNILFEIEENRKIKVEEFNILGNENFKKKWWEKSWFSNFTKHQDKVMHNFKNIKGERKWYSIWRGKFSNSGFKEDLDNLEKFYKSAGFKDFQIIKKDIIFNEKSISIDLEIDEGMKYYYKSFKFTGNNKYSDEELLEALDINIGEKYNEEKFNFSIYENIQSIYMDAGYYKFNIETQFIPAADDSLDVVLSIQENDRYKIRKVLITGNIKTRENVIRRELNIYPGDNFNREKIINSLRELYMLNFFNDIVPQISEVKDKSEVDIIFHVSEKEAGRANFSMGYNEVHGITGGGGVEFPNFMGKGQLFQIEYQRGVQNQLQSNSIVPSSSGSASDYESFSVSFREPRIFDTNNSIGISITYLNRGRGSNNVYTYGQKRTSVSFSFGRKFRWPDKYFSGGWSLGVYQTKYFGDLSDLIDDFPEDDISYSNNPYAVSKGVTLSQNITRDSRNKAEFPTIGSRISWSSSFTGGVLGGNKNFNKHILSFDWYVPLKDQDFVLFQNYKFGVINQLDDDTYIPVSGRFLMGGSGIPYGEMLRGYGDNTVGPRSINNNYYSASGGNIMLKYGVELRYLLTDNPLLYILFFAEAGNVWSDFDNVDIFDVKRCAGLGIRLHMPMLGVLGYDMGYGFDSILDDGRPSGWEYHLIFGMPFN